MKKLVEIKGWRRGREGSGRQNSWQHRSPSDTVPDRERRPRGGEEHWEMKSKRSAAAPMLQSLAGELLKDFERESNKLCFTFSKAALAASKWRKDWSELGKAGRGGRGPGRRR